MRDKHLAKNTIEPAENNDWHVNDRAFFAVLEDGIIRSGTVTEISVVQNAAILHISLDTPTQQTKTVDSSCAFKTEQAVAQAAQFKPFDVTISAFGSVTVYAENEDAALRAARDAKHEDVTWEADGLQPTDVHAIEED